MIRYIILFYLTIAATPSKVQSQTITIEFIDSAQSIPFVTVFDSANSVARASDESGRIALQPKKYNLQISHVAYETEMLKLDLLNFKDSIYYIKLKRRSEELRDIIFTQTKLNRYVLESGSISQPYPFRMILHQNLKIGVLLNSIQGEKKHCIKSIKFKILKDKLIVPKNFILEIKVYEVLDGIISSISLNKKPIYISSDSLKKNNEVRILEKITFEGDKLFVSYQVPYIKEPGSPLIAFAGYLISDDCETFVMKNNIPWNENILNGNCLVDEISGKHCRLSTSVTYQNEE